ncbi:MAG: hypothetical protein IPH53_00015 [Flavobacteriales bacterium]|nr:hypothetical protein [Flavobacteriales bacterium]
MQRIVLLLALLGPCAPNTGSAQTLDSLWAVWNNETLPDTARMLAMDYIAFDHYMDNKPDTAHTGSTGV